MAGVDLPTLHAQLERWAGAHYHEGVGIAGLETMPGHAGLSFGFRVEHAGRVLDDLVMRLPPKGVRRSGNTDVLRQVPLLQAMARAGVPVATVVWWDADEQWFDVPYLMVGRLPGSTWNVREAAVAGRAAEATAIFRQAVEALAAVHRVPWRDELGRWEAPKDLHAEVVFWDRLLERAAEPAWVDLGRAVRDRLLATLPADPVVGVFHGDFQTNNLLFHQGRLQAVLDWEISGIGAQLLDLGWLLMMNDPESWADGEGLAIVPPFTDLVGRYAEAVQRDVGLSDVAWYRALSGYRFGVISCFNVMLHRTGKRPDAEWERIAPSVPYLFGRAADLLG
jgi:aminoglycoside phosphotransferase (APT) family kinase protein